MTLAHITTLAQMTVGQWLFLVFVGLFLLLMFAGLITWVIQLARSRRRHGPKRKRPGKSTR